MNNKYEEFCRDNENIIDNLLERLSVLLDKFEHGVIPGEPEKSNALQSINAYIDAIEKFTRVENPKFKLIKRECAKINEDAAYKELSKESIALLMRLVHEKIIDIEDQYFQSDEGKLLLKSDYCDEVVMQESKRHYYVLSDKSVNLLRNKSFIGRIRKDFASFITPNVMINNAENWSNLYARRIELFKKYYTQKREDAEYILFILDEAKEMVFACELNDSVEVRYYFAGIFDEKMDAHINQLKGLVNSGLIDEMVVIVDSDQVDEIFEDEGIKSTPHILIERL